MEARDEGGDERAVEEEAELEVWRRRAAGGEGGGEDENVRREGERGEGGGFEEAALRTRTTERPAEVK